MLRARRAAIAVLALGLAFNAGEAHAQKTKPLTKKERERREQEKKDAAKKEQDKKDADAAAQAEEDEKKKKAALAANQPAPPPTPPPEKEWDDTVEAQRAIYISVDLAYTRADMATFADSTAFDRSAGNGFLFGLSGGLRLKDYRFGLRYRIYDATDFTLWSFALQAGYAFKYRPVTPIISGHLGYVFDQSIERPVIEGSLPEGTVLTPDVDVKGLILGGDAQASYWVTKWFRVGAFLGIDLMFLSRAKAPLPQSVFGPTPEAADRPLFKDSGFGIGLNLNLGFRGTFDLGIE